MESQKDKRKKELLLYDITSNYVEGERIGLTEYGYNRDGQKRKKQR